MNPDALLVLINKDNASITKTVSVNRCLLAAAGVVSTFDVDGQQPKTAIIVGIKFISVSRSLRIAAVCNTKGEAHIVDYTTLSMIRRLPQSDVTCVASSHTGTMLAICCTGVMYIWNMKNAKTASE